MLGDRLLVGVSTDEFNKKKNKKSVNSFEERCEILSSCQYVDGTFPETDWEQKRIDITKYNINIFTMGDDWVGEFDFLADICQVMYLPRTEGISTTFLKNNIATNFSYSIENSFHEKAIEKVIANY